MRKVKRGLLLICTLAAVLFVSSFFAWEVSAKEREVYLGGMPAGFTLGMGGAQVVGMCEVLTEEGVVCPAKDAGVEVGDIIVSLNGMRIRSAADIDAALTAA